MTSFHICNVTIIYHWPWHCYFNIIFILWSTPQVDGNFSWNLYQTLMRFLSSSVSVGDERGKASSSCYALITERKVNSVFIFVSTLSSRVWTLASSFQFKMVQRFQQKQKFALVVCLCCVLFIILHFSDPTVLETFSTRFRCVPWDFDVIAHRWGQLNTRYVV